MRCARGSTHAPPHPAAITFKDFPMDGQRPLAIVTGASSGIGLHLALEAASRGYDLILAADESLTDAESNVRSLGAQAESVVCDLATADGVEKLYSRARGRKIDALLANAGR